jgi:hypothetical protein
MAKPPPSVPHSPLLRLRVPGYLANRVSRYRRWGRQRGIPPIFCALLQAVRADFVCAFLGVGNRQRRREERQAVSRRDDKAMAGRLDNKPAPVSNCDDRACVDAKTIRHSARSFARETSLAQVCRLAAAAMQSALTTTATRRRNSCRWSVKLPERETRSSPSKRTPAERLGRGPAGTTRQGNQADRASARLTP